MSEAEDWFRGDEPRTADEARFLAVLRSHHDTWLAAGLTPSCTAASAPIAPLHLQIEVPELPPEHINLQVGYWQSGHRGPGVEGEWGDRYFLDSGGPGSLEVFGLPAEPEELAELASRWLIAQLACAIDRSDWVDRTGNVIASRWTIADTGLAIGQSGAWTRRLRRRPADRIVRVR